MGRPSSQFNCRGEQPARPDSHIAVAGVSQWLALRNKRAIVPKDAR